MMRAVLLPALVLLGGCATLPGAPPSQPGAETAYKALGTEPFWALTLTGKEMIFKEANTRLPISETQPQPIHGFAGDIYQGRRIHLNIVRGVGCSDGMSDRRYPDKVQVRVDDRAFEGCGGEVLPPPALAGTSWSVIAINGRPVADAERYFVRFDGDRMAARFGCNSLSTPVQQVGARVISGALVATRMACSEMRDEREGSAVLSRPFDLIFGPGDDLTLNNDAGFIKLRRAI
jgi:uncharacterized membrane protein